MEGQGGQKQTGLLRYLENELNKPNPFVVILQTIPAAEAVVGHFAFLFNTIR